MLLVSNMANPPKLLPSAKAGLKTVPFNEVIAIFALKSAVQLTVPFITWLGQIVASRCAKPVRQYSLYRAPWGVYTKSVFQT